MGMLWVGEGGGVWMDCQKIMPLLPTLPSGPSVALGHPDHSQSSPGLDLKKYCGLLQILLGIFPWLILAKRSFLFVVSIVKLKLLWPMLFYENMLMEKNYIDIKTLLLILEIRTLF